MSVSVAKWGNSAALRLPKNVLETLSLNIGDSVNFVQKGQDIVIEPCKPSLDDLLSKVTAENRHAEAITGVIGKELL